MVEPTAACRSLKESLLLYLNENVEVSTFETQCVITLPLRTLDHRLIDICIERKIGDLVIVHDAGKAASELFSQGIHLTNVRESVLKEVARRYGATFSDGTFTVTCKDKPGEIETAILAVGQCASLAMYDVLKHTPTIEEEPVTALVRRALDRWQPEDVELRYRVPVKSQLGGVDHMFDAVLFPRRTGKRTVAVKALTLGYPPQVQADRYGFLALDIRGTVYDEWPREAIISKVDRWSEPALRQVRSLSARTLELREGDEQRVDSDLRAHLTELLAA